MAGRAESVSSPLAPGAGRYVDYSYPTMDNYFNASTRSLYARVGYTFNSNLALAVSQGAGSTFGYRVQNGVPALMMFSGNVLGAGFSLRFLDPTQLGSFGITPRLAASSIPATCDDFAVWRIYANIAFQATPAADCDFGMELVFPPAGGEQLIFLNNRPGIGFVRRASGVVALVINNGAVLTFFPVGAPLFPGFDPTVFHVYEWRIVSGRVGVNAQLIAMVDGVALTTLSWDNPIMPAYNAAFPQAQMTLCAYADGTKTYCVQRLRVCASQTIAGTL